MTKQATEAITSVEAMRNFDLDVVRSAIRFWNDWSALPSGQEIPFDKFVADAFGWLPAALRKRALEIGLTAPRWEGYAVGGLIDAHSFLSMLAWAGIGHPLPGRGQSITHIQIGDRKESLRRREIHLAPRITVEDWISKELHQLAIDTRLRYVNGQIIRVDLPLLKTAERCVLYAVALVLEDRHSLRGRVKLCPFDRHGRHLFLDYRLKADGKFMRPRDYCCPKHQNAANQQHFRNEHKVKKPRKGK